MKNFKKLSVDDVLKNSQQKKKAFTEKRKSDEFEKRLVIEKTGEIFFKKHFKDIGKDLIDELRRKITDISLAQMVNFALDRKDCPCLQSNLRLLDYQFSQ